MLFWPHTAHVMHVDLSQFENSSFSRGRSALTEVAWMIASAVFFRHGLAVGSQAKAAILRFFGARVGRGVIIKPSVQIKFPWKLTVGDHVWIGDHAWIDNLDEVTIGSHVCISQGALLLCGNHDYASPRFALITKPIVVEDGAWIGARGLVCPGVRVGSHAILTAGSVATHDLEPFGIYQGNPAAWKRARTIEGHEPVANR